MREPPVIGRLFPLEEHRAVDVVAGLGPCTIVANDPPWSMLAPLLPDPARLVRAGDMEQAGLHHLVAAEPDDSAVVVGIGGGTALDTAKFLAWRTGKRLVQIPTITSVDAGFTDAVGVRVDGRVRYVGRVEPELVVLDLDLVRSAPPHLNRAGIGDVLSCLTGLHDWRLAVDAGAPPPWRDDLAALARRLLAELDDATAEVRAASPDGVRFLVSAYRRIGAACAEAGHSRFEEGSEHFWAYAYEHATGAHHVHGELIALAVVALSHLQDNDPSWPADIVARCGTRAHPSDLGITEGQFTAALLGLRAYAHDEDLDISVVDLREVTLADTAGAWTQVCRLPRADPSA